MQKCSVPHLPPNGNCFYITGDSFVTVYVSWDPAHHVVHLFETLSYSKIVTLLYSKAIMCSKGSKQQIADHLYNLAHAAHVFNKSTLF